MKTKLTALSLGLFVVLLSACGPPQPQAAGKSVGSESRFTVAGRFAGYYEAHGGLKTLGEPISLEITKGAITHQYFQNGRLEYNPAAAPGAEISMSALGLEFTEPEEPATPTAEPGALCYVETGHCVTAFREFFEKYGGVAFFGYPISDLKMDETGWAVQHFERAWLVWDIRLPAGERIQLSALGVLMCAQTNCQAVDTAGPPRPEEEGVEISTPTPVGAPFGEFVANHGGAAVFGEPLTLPGQAPDGTLQQVYANAVLIQDPAAPEGVRLRALGLARRPLDPPAPQVDDPDGYYDPITGHNVLFEFRPFYDRVGGLLVLGRPITEITADESGQAVQYFENGRMEYHSAAPPDERVRLSPLGRELLETGGGDIGLPTPPPQVLTVQTWAETPVLGLGQQQVIHVRVSDEQGQPLQGATVRLSVDSNGAAMDYALPPTGGDGQTAVGFVLSEWRPGQMVLFTVTVEHNGLQAEPMVDQFIQWHGPLPTPTPIFAP